MRQKSYQVRIAGAAAYLPEGLASNEAVIERVRAATPEADFLTSEWIVERVGIETRRKCLPHETLVETSCTALERALAGAGWKATDLDFVILASISTSLEPKGMIIPATACLIQERIGAFNAFAYDMLAACSGFVYGMAQGVSFIDSGMCRRGAVLCSENHDAGLNYADPKSCILIGDASTATLLERSETPMIHDVMLAANDEKRLSSIITLPYRGYFGLDGRTVYKEGVQTMKRLTHDIVTRNGLRIADIDWFIYHQANALMLENVGRTLEIPAGRNLMNIQRVGNTTAATIPSVLVENLENGSIQRGHKLVLVAFGGGLTSGAILATY